MSFPANLGSVGPSPQEVQANQATQPKKLSLGLAKKNTAMLEKIRAPGANSQTKDLTISVKHLTENSENTKFFEDSKNIKIIAENTHVFDSNKDSEIYFENSNLENNVKVENEPKILNDEINGKTLNENSQKIITLFSAISTQNHLDISKTETKLNSSIDSSIKPPHEFKELNENELLKNKKNSEDLRSIFDLLNKNKDIAVERVKFYDDGSFKKSPVKPHKPIKINEAILLNGNLLVHEEHFEKHEHNISNFMSKNNTIKIIILTNEQFKNFSSTMLYKMNQDKDKDKEKKNSLSQKENQTLDYKLNYEFNFTELKINSLNTDFLKIISKLKFIFCVISDKKKEEVARLLEINEKQRNKISEEKREFKILKDKKTDLRIHEHNKPKHT